MKSLKEYREQWKRERESNKKAWGHIKKNNREGCLLLMGLTAFWIGPFALLVIFLIEKTIDAPILIPYAEQFNIFFFWMLAVSIVSWAFLADYAIFQARREIGLPYKR